MPLLCYSIAKHDYDIWLQRITAVFPEEGRKGIIELYVVRNVGVSVDTGKTTNLLTGFLINAVTSLRRKEQRKSIAVGKFINFCFLKY
jgi:hypothetical protein